MIMDIEKMLSDLLGVSEMKVYNNESVKIKMLRQEDVASLAEFMYHHRQSTVKTKGETTKESVIDIEYKLRDGIGDDEMPPSFFAIIAVEEDNEKEDMGKKSTELKLKQRINGAAILTTDWNINESNAYINVEELFIPRESSATTNALLLVLSAISLSNGIHFNDKHISILKPHETITKSESDSVHTNEEDHKILSSDER